MSTPEILMLSIVGIRSLTNRGRFMCREPKGSNAVTNFSEMKRLLKN